MSLSSAARIAQSGLNTVTAEAATLSRNIAGASTTTIYTRKIANVTTTPGSSQLVSVARASNLAVFANMLSATSSNATQDALTAGLNALNQTIGDVSSSIDGTTSSASSPAALLSNFTNALQAYEASPSNSTLASTAVFAAGDLADKLNSASATVQGVREDADAGMSSAVRTVNALLAQFQSVNLQIVNGTATGVDVTDAQDARDNILKQLSNEIGITTTSGANNDMSIYTDSGVTLFQGGAARSVAFSATNTYSAATVGHAVYVDGVPVTGSSATMPVASGKIAGLATLRDSIAVTYQVQLDGIAATLINVFAESDQIGSGPDLPGLFTIAGATSVPVSATGLAGQIIANPNVDPAQGGNSLLLRDGGISVPTNPAYTYNTSGDASYTSRLSQLLGSLAAPQSFSPTGAITTTSSLSTYASASVSWLEGQRSHVSAQSTYQSAMLSAATSALSNETGVNLDDEMAKMLDLERAYAATAKLITTIDGMFATLLADLGSLPA